MSKNLKLTLFVLFFALMALLLAAQSTNASIIGKVTDKETGKPIKDVVITATEMKTNGQMIRNSNKKGKYRFVTVPPGAYRITFEHEGYKSVIVNCAVSAEQTVTVKPEMTKKEPEPPTEDSED